MKHELEERLIPESTRSGISSMGVSNKPMPTPAFNEGPGGDVNGRLMHTKRFSMPAILGLIISVMLLPAIKPVSAQGRIEPLVYPAGVIGTGTPSFIWQDIYNTPEPAKGQRFRLTITARDTAAARPVIMLINPRIYYNAFFGFDLPSPLADGAYEYSIERMEGAEAVNGKYYHYLHYPIKKEFSIDSTRAGRVDRLPADDRIRFLYGERRNILENGYNSLFFAGSGIMSFVIGMLF